MGRVGGLTPVIAIHDACHEASVPCWVGGSPGSAIATRIALAVAAKENCTYPADYLPSEGWICRDLAPSPATALVDGKQSALLWSEPGIGVEPDTEAIEASTLAHARFDVSNSD